MMVKLRKWVHRSAVAMIAAGALAVAACSGDLSAADEDEGTTDVETGFSTNASETAVVAIASEADPGDKAVSGNVWEIVNRDGRAEQFTVAADNSVRHRWQGASGAWSAWASLEGTLLYGDLAAAMNVDGRVELFGVGTNHALYTIYQTRPSAGPWSGWRSRGGYYTSVPRARAFGSLLGACMRGRSGQTTWCNHHTQPTATSPFRGEFVP